MQSMAPQRTFPNKLHSVWMMLEMIRWGHLHPGADIVSIADRCCDTAPYRQAAASLRLPCPADDFAPMPLRHGRFLTRENMAKAIQEKVAQLEAKTESTGNALPPRKSWAAERTS